MSCSLCGAKPPRKDASLDRIRQKRCLRVPLPRQRARKNSNQHHPLDNAFSDDWVGVSLDSSRAGQLAYHLFVNPSGIQMDALQSGSGGEDFAPDWVWQSAGHVGADGWSAEIRVPLENIRFRSGADVRMGVLFWRRLSRTGVSTSWPEMAPSKWVFESNAVVSFDELQSRRLFEMIPSATFSGNQSDQIARGGMPHEHEEDVGVSNTACRQRSRSMRPSTRISVRSKATRLKSR
jgi:hypothetical protein